jgi:uncharacterized Zn finger protein
MPRENAFDKSRRLLVSGAVRIIRCDRSGVLALVAGDTEGLHTVRYDGHRWTCDCSALSVCSHGLAVAAVTAPPGPWVAAAESLVIVGG